MYVCMYALVSVPRYMAWKSGLWRKWNKCSRQFVGFLPAGI